MAKRGRTSVDPYRLDVAVHELAHWFAWRHAGFTIAIRHIRVRGYGEGAEGNVHIGRRPIRTAEQARGYLTGLLAGREADLRSRDETGREFYEYTCRGDLETFQKFRGREWTAGVSDEEFRRAARALVDASWSQITVLAPRLASRGYL